VDRASSCYKVVYEEHSWTAAGRRCHDLHPEAHLAAITNSDENLGLMAYLQPELASMCDCVHAILHLALPYASSSSTCLCRL